MEKDITYIRLGSGWRGTSIKEDKSCWTV